MPAENISCVGRRFLGDVHESHVCLFQFPSAFAVITMGARGNNIGPNMLTPKMARDDMVHRQTSIPLTAILAGIIVSTENLPAGQFDMRTRSVDLRLKPDD